MLQFDTENGKIIAPIKLDDNATKLMIGLEGRKRWLSTGGFQFENTQSNLDLFAQVYPDIEIPDQNPQTISSEFIELFDEKTEYKFRTTPYQKQLEAFEKCKDMNSFALFMEQGTGKTKVALDKAGYLFTQRKITGLLVISLPGVHRQWAEVQIPTHLNVPAYVDYWSKDEPDQSVMKPSERLAIFSTYIQAIVRKSGLNPCVAFIRAHKGKVLIIVDESTSIKNPNSLQSQQANNLAGMCDYRMIMSGTPFLNEPTDLWSQFNFLDQRILGFKYKTSFRKEFCVLGGYGGTQVIGAKNLQRLKAKYDPYAFRCLKSEMVDLPEKIYTDWLFTISPQQKEHYNSMRDMFLAQIESGEISTSVNGAVALMRLQQIASGFMQMDNGQLIELQNARLKALQEIIESRPNEKIIIWARFNKDIENIMKLLGDKAVSYYGATEKETARPEAVKEFLDENSSVRYFVSNPMAGGVGLNLQGDCATVIFYSNSFSVLSRWQAEDRSHRIGTTRNVEYINMIAKNTIDRKILRALREKKVIAAMALGDMKELIYDDGI